MNDKAAITTEKRDDPATVLAIGALAYMCSDLAHEVLGHALGLLIAGGRAGIFTTTRLIYLAQLPNPQWRIFDLGGPVGNLAWAALCFGMLPVVRGARLRLFLWASMAFSLFWEFGYLLKAGATGSGDPMALIEGLPRQILWRAIILMAGVVLYSWAVRMTGTKLKAVFDGDSRARVKSSLWAVYLAGGIIACAGAFLDPRGRGEILRSGAASSFLAGIGILFAGSRFAEGTNSAGERILRNWPWIVIAVAAASGYVFVLGPGIPWRI